MDGSVPCNVIGYNEMRFKTGPDAFFRDKNGWCPEAIAPAHPVLHDLCASMYKTDTRIFNPQYLVSVYTLIGDPALRLQK